ncbi:hypothetical protein Dxin01_04120 [Deinococcus xinjiangensis]|uniref:Uncharacterized protein n=1 Tax=Deinococcus xinjiangensis TaxID=457454 RepID=A0ABP9VJB7_9DEIO
MFILKMLWAVIKASLYVIGAIFDGLSAGGKAANKWHGSATESPTRNSHSRAYIGPDKH